MPRSSSCSMMHSASVVLPEPEPPSTAAWRFSTFLLSVIDLAPGRSSRPARMLEPPPFSSRMTDSGSSSSSPIGGSAAPPATARRCRAPTAAAAVRLRRRWPPPRLPPPPTSAARGRAGRGAAAGRSRAGRTAAWRCSNQSAKPGSWRWWAWNSRTIIMRSHSGIGTRIERPPPSRNLRKACAVWFLLLGGKSLARSMKQLLGAHVAAARGRAGA